MVTAMITATVTAMVGMKKTLSILASAIVDSYGLVTYDNTAS